MIYAAPSASANDKLRVGLIGAVIIATPDHVRVRVAIMACAKGLDIYAEKPLSFCIPEGRALVEAVRKHKRVLQVGTQQRSTPINQYVCKIDSAR